jgi:hypothetical protein
MNIFYLDRDPRECAKMHCDKHVVKMIIEYAQLMSTAHRVLDGYQDIEKRYVAGSLPPRWRNVKIWTHPNKKFDREMMKASHINHPSNVWLRQSKNNYVWLYQMWICLLNEYTYRYGKTHACARLIEVLNNIPSNMEDSPFTEPTPAMPDECKIAGDSLSSYHKYYIDKKIDFAKWKNRDIPEWFSKGINNANIYVSQ